MKIFYDKEVDVLYITLDDLESIVTEVDPGNFIRHYAYDCGIPEITGITIIDFKERYMK